MYFEKQTSKLRVSHPNNTIVSLHPKIDIVTQRVDRQNKLFGYCIKTSTNADDSPKRSLFLKLIGPSQEIFETLPENGNNHEETLVA